MRGFVLLFAVVISVFTGCNDEAENKVLVRRTNLVTGAQEYRAFYDANDRAPKDNQEFQTYLEGKENSPELTDLLSSMKEGDVVFLWNGKLADAEDSDILVFEANVPGGGGYVVTVNAEVKLVTAADFNSSKKIAQSKE